MKIKNILLISLLIFGIIPLNSCSSEIKHSKDEPLTLEMEESSTKTENELLYGFETYDELASMSPLYYFGRLSRTNDIKTEGEFSLKWEIESVSNDRYNEVSLGTDAYPQLTIFSDNYYKDISSISNTINYTLDVFNDNDFDVVFMLSALGGNEIFASSHTILKANKWNQVVTPVRKNIIGTREKISALNICVYNEVFNRPCTLLIDNLRKQTASFEDKEIKPDEEFGSISKLNSIDCLNFITPHSMESPAYTIPTPFVDVELNTNKNYTKDNANSIKLSCIPCVNYHMLSDLTYCGEKQWIGLEFDESIISKVDFKRLGYVNNPVVSIDAYNGNNSKMVFHLKITDNHNNSSTQDTIIDKNSWGKVAISNFEGVALDNILKVEVFVDLYYINEQTNFYFNNLRIGDDL